jgi:hypothetical protein
MTVRPMPPPRTPLLGDGQTGSVGDVGHDAVAACDSTTMLPQSPWPSCDYPGPHRVSPGTPPHHQRLSCGTCGHWLCWLPKPRPVAQEGRAWRATHWHTRAHAWTGQLRPVVAKEIQPWH